MTDKTIKLELPVGGLILRHAGTMLLAMADELDGKAPAVIADTTASAGGFIDPDKEMAAAKASDAAGVTVGAEAALITARLGTDGVLSDPPPPPAGVEVDEAGLPWDVRINPDSRGQLKTGARKGCWKYKKQLDPALIVSVEAELKAAMAVEPPTLDNTTAAAPPPPAGDDTTAAAPPPPAGDTATGAPGMDFAALVLKVTGLQAEGRLTPEQANAAAVAAGLANFMLVANRPDLVPAVNTEIDKLCPPIQ